jgi:hypothetical protein
MSSDELQTLGADIVKNGLTSPIALWRAHPDGQAVLLDGRNRLDAIEMATGKAVEIGAPSLMAGEFLATDKVVELDGRKVDPVAYVISANIHRRHLTTEDKDRLIVELLKADSTKSNRQVAKIVDASHPHVAKVREQAEQAGDVETVTTSIDTKGRKQPAKKTRIKQAKKASAEKKPPAESEPVEPVEPVEPANTVANNDVGTNSVGEVERLTARIQELEDEKHRLELKVAGFESEIEELKTENAATAPPDLTTLLATLPAAEVTSALATKDVAWLLDVIPMDWRSQLEARVVNLYTQKGGLPDWKVTQKLREALLLVKAWAPDSNNSTTAAAPFEAATALVQLNTLLARNKRDLDDIVVSVAKSKARHRAA